MWSESKLKETAARRKKQREGFKHLERAALAYARMANLTAESGVDPDRAQAELDQLLDQLAPEDWKDIEALSTRTDDRVLKGLMSYSLKRWQRELQREQRELEALTNWPDAQTKKKSRRKRRDRER